MRMAGVVVALVTAEILVGGGTARAQSFYSSGHGGLCVDIAGGRMAPGTRVQLWNCHGGAPQRFGVDPRSQQIFVEGRRDLCLHTSTVPGKPAEMMLFDCRFVTDKWVYDAGRRQIRSSLGLCWDVPGANKDANRFRAGQPLIAFKCHGQINQQFVYNAPSPAPAPVGVQALQPGKTAAKSKKEQEREDKAGTIAAVAILGAAVVAALGEEANAEQPAPPPSKWVPPPEPGPARAPAPLPWAKAPNAPNAALDPLAPLKLVYTKGARPFSTRLAADYKIADDHGKATSMDGPGEFDWDYASGGGQDGVQGSVRYQVTAQTASRASVKVTFRNFEPHELRYDLVLEGGRWLIDEVYCVVCASHAWKGPVSRAWREIAGPPAVRPAPPAAAAAVKAIEAPRPPPQVIEPTRRVELAEASDTALASEAPVRTTIVPKPTAGKQVAILAPGELTRPRERPREYHVAGEREDLVRRLHKRELASYGAWKLEYYSEDAEGARAVHCDLTRGYGSEEWLRFRADGKALAIDFSGNGTAALGERVPVSYRIDDG